MPRVVRAVLLLAVAVCLVIGATLRPTPLPRTAVLAWRRILEAESDRPPQVPPAADQVIARDTAQTVTQGVPVAVSAGQPASIVGWAIDPNTRSAATHVYVRVDGGAWRLATSGLSRPDVAQAFHAPDVANSGYRANIPGSELTIGRHSVQITAWVAAPELLMTTVILDARS